VGQLALQETVGQVQLPLGWMVTPRLLPLLVGNRKRLNRSGPARRRRVGCGGASFIYVRPPRRHEVDTGDSFGLPLSTVNSFGTHYER
jgi:hypothetical protein